MKSAWMVAGRALAVALLVLAGNGCSSKHPANPDGGDGRRDVVEVPQSETGGTDGRPDGSVDHVCPATGIKKPMGESCECASECASGFCADGVCCTTACTEGCKTCSAASSVGTCTSLVAGATPVGAMGAGTKTTCAPSAASTCGLDGKCDGVGECRNWPTGTACKGGSCEGDAVAGGFACNGTGQCKPSATVICAPYTCDSASGKCFDGCTTPAQCVSTQACTAGSCGKRMKGATCHVNDDCASGFCADGVCCNVACGGPCVACNQLGRLGTCWPIDIGLPDPRGKCVDEGKPSCGHTGTCDGVGGCSKYAKDTMCEPPSCSGNKLNTAGTCDGLGTCGQPGVTNCHPFRCVNGACTNACQTDADCDTGIGCVKGTCGPKLNGQTCAAGSECVSTFCVDGICCENACSGACRSCALPTSPGRCITIAAGNPDPRNVCKDGKATSCGNNGKCDGMGSCQKYPVGTQCADETCASNVYTPPSTCNASNQCVAPDALPCAPYVCNGSKCFNACTADAQCLNPPTNVCTMNSCGPKPIGASCSTAGECGSHFCEQGICCQTACAGACRSCALAGSLGTCTNVALGAVDPAAVCTDMGQTSCGLNGKCQAGSCQKYTLGTACKDPTCPAGTTTSTGGSTCDGAGACLTPGTISCFPYQCGTNVCRNACASDADCALPAVCINGSCGLKPKGLPCSDLTECQSGYCAQGFCCESACTDRCKSCGLTGSRGTCTNVPNGQADPKQSCADMGTASCSTDGFCDGNGGCRLYDATTSCAAPTCPSGTWTATPGRTCDGRGTCQTVNTIACAPYVCNGTTACKAACTSDADCLTGNICDPQTNLCGNKRRLGQSCSATTDCLTGASCVDGVCCSASACGTCQACNVAGSAGNCTNVALGVGEPHGLCAANPPCGNTGACNGAGACQQAGTGVSCGTASCSGSTFTPISHCNGTGGCAAPTASSCGNYVCGAAACKTTCTADGDCVAPNTCQAGNCAQKPNGLICTSASQCISGFCTNGVCCGSASCPTCQACNVNGAGSCAPLVAGTPAPAGQCAAAPPCGNTGTCDGTGACTQGPTSVACGTASCSGSTLLPVSHCNGGGGCADPVPSTCAPYVCGTNACNSTCPGVGSGCVSGYYCTGTNGSCMPLKSSGAACGADGECGTGHCTDGHCCGVTGCPTCQACGSSGMCANVVAGTGDARCTPAPPCGNTGTCDGSGACQQAATSVACGTASCSGSTYSPISHCNGGGGCAAPTTSSCSPYICGASACRVTCSTDNDCIDTNYYCTGTNGSCVAKKSLGATCGATHECGSGNCTDGFCCGVASCPTCQACGSSGACGNVGAGAADSRCTPAPPCGNTGTCNGSGACTQAGTGVACGTASCSGSTLTPVSHCNGSGGCAAPVQSTCAPYLCGASACNSTCSGVGSGCVSGYYCTGTNGSCMPLKSSGAVCGSSSECGTGHCTDGHCCGVASCPTCQTCGGSGMCVDVAAGTADTGCPAAPPCGNTGVCDGSGACQQGATSVQCGSASCTGSTYTPAAFCSGGGTCASPGTMSCGAYVCGTNACKTICSVDGDCTGGNYCTGANGSCLAKKATGVTCTADHECGTGNCTDGVCCTVAVCGTCQACNLTANGTCGTVTNGNPEPNGLCPASAPCGNTGLCNGGACQKASTSVQCGNPSCSGTTYTPPAFCSGSGTCSSPGTMSCGAYVCGTTACKFLCASDNDCSSGNYCTGPNGSCVSKKALAATCAADHECGSGSCTDGVCCTVSACGTCQACNLTTNGTCGTVGNGNPEPNNLCPTGATCGNTGLCSAGACQQASTSVQCANPSCTGSTLTLPAFCSGAGTCSTPGTMSCGTYVCGTNACKVSCSSDSDCTTGNYCTGTNGSCVSKKALATTCGTDHECGSGNCTDGVCCTVSACGACHACNLTANGTCGIVANGNAEPNGLCPTSTTCGNTGVCSGGACQQAATTVMCNAGSCVSSTTYQPAAFCSGTGTCATPGTVLCSPFTCTSSGCPGSCNVDGDCALATDYCTGTGGSCQPKRTNGMTCAGDNQCSSTHCTEGYCCGDSACLHCQSCAVPGLQGTCSNVLDGGADPLGMCPNDGAATCQRDGTCNGSGGCRLYGTGTVCTASCAVDNLVLTSTYCDGLGACGPVTVPSACGTAVCIAGPPSTCQ